MTFGDVNQFPMERLSLHPIHLSILIIGLVQFFYMHIIPLYVKRIYEFFSRPESFFQSQTDSVNNLCGFESSNQLSCVREKKMDDGSLSREDAEKVMERLGIFCHLEGEKLQERFGSDDLSELFEEKEPSLEEVKGAFDVFDENRDGFIDERELQRVLRVLGFKEGSELHSCRNMIRTFDENGDGRIDFSEFVKFMENSFG